MSNKPRPEKSEFLQAAEAFDSELAGFHRLVEASLHGALTSVKQLERAGQTMTQVGEAEKRLSAASQVLSTAIANSHKQQLEAAQRLQERAQIIELRTAQFNQLMEGYRVLGKAANALNDAVVELARKKKESAGNGTSTELVHEFQALQGQMVQVAQTAQQLVDAARGADFEDIARQIDAIRQQLLAASSPKILR